jgi:mono/diheme cytochrome c family protein
MGNTAVVVVLLATALLASVADRATAQPFTRAQDPAAGARLFTDKGCVTCHAINGKGGKIGPDLGRIPRPRTFFDLAAGLWNHAPKMAARMKASGIQRPTLTPRESSDLAGYLFTVSYFDRPGNADVGQKLFTSKQCVTCHRVGGRGGDVGPPLDGVKTSVSPISLAAAMWNHGGVMAAEMEKKGIERPTFKAGELIDLIAYINRESPKAATEVYVLPGRASEGMRLLIDKRCLECHSASGRAENPMNLADREAHKSVTDFAAAMWNKLPKMRLEMIARNVAFRQLKPEEMADIVAFLYSVRYFAEAGDPRNGVILAADKGCLGCHGLYGEQGKPASDLSRSEATATAPGTLSTLWNHSFIADPRPADKQKPWPMLSGKQMADLMTYLRSLKRVP